MSTGGVERFNLVAVPLLEDALNYYFADSHEEALQQATRHFEACGFSVIPVACLEKPTVLLVQSHGSPAKRMLVKLVPDGFPEDGRMTEYKKRLS